MMIVMKPTATEEDIQAVIDRIESCGARAHPSRGEEVTVIGAIGDREHVQRLGLEGHAGRRAGRPDPAPVQALLGPVPLMESDPSSRSTGDRIGGEHFTMIAGPCTVESRDQTLVDGAHRGRGRRLDVPRRRLQAALVAVQLPGPRPGGPAAAGRGQGARPACRSSPS